eukprot:gene3296-13322_t
MRIRVRAFLLLLFCEFQQSWLTSVNATGIPRAPQSPKGKGGSFTFALWLQTRSFDVHTWTLGTSPDGWFLSFNVLHGAEATQVALVLPSQPKSSDAHTLLSPHLLVLHSWHHVVFTYNPVPHRTKLCVDGRCTTLTLNRTAVTFLLGEGSQGGSSSSGNGPRIHDAELCGEELSEASIDWLQATSCPSHLALPGLAPAIDESMMKTMMGSEGSEAWQWSCLAGQLCDYATVPCPSSGCSYDETSLQQTSKASAGLQTKSPSKEAATRKFGFGAASIGRQLEELIQEEVGCDHSLKVYFSEMIGLAVALNIVAILALALAFYVYHLRLKLKKFSDCGRVGLARASGSNQDQPIRSSLHIPEPRVDPIPKARLPSDETPRFEDNLAYTSKSFSVDEAPPSFLTLIKRNASSLRCSTLLSGMEAPIANKLTPPNRSFSQPQIDSKGLLHSSGPSALQLIYSLPILRTVWSMWSKRSSGLSSKDASQKSFRAPQTDNPLYSREHARHTEHSLPSLSLYHSPSASLQTPLSRPPAVQHWIGLSSVSAENVARIPLPANSTGDAFRSAQQRELGLPSAPHLMPPQYILPNQDNSLGWGPDVPSSLPPARHNGRMTIIAGANTSQYQNTKEPYLNPENNGLLLSAIGSYQETTPADKLRLGWLVGSSSTEETRGMSVGQWPENFEFFSNSSSSSIPIGSFRSSSKIDSLGICEVLSSVFNQAPAPVDEAWLPDSGNAPSKLCLHKASPGSLSQSRCSSVSQVRLPDAGPSCTTQDMRCPNYPYPVLGGLSPMAQARGSPSFHPPDSASPTSVSSTRGGSSLYSHVSKGVTLGIGGTSGGQESPSHPGSQYGDLAPLILQSSINSSGLGSPLGSETLV